MEKMELSTSSYMLVFHVISSASDVSYSTTSIMFPNFGDVD